MDTLAANSIHARMELVTRSHSCSVPAPCLIMFSSCSVQLWRGRPTFLTYAAVRGTMVSPRNATSRNSFLSGSVKTWPSNFNWLILTERENGVCLATFRTLSLLTLAIKDGLMPRIFLKQLASNPSNLLKSPF